VDCGSARASVEYSSAKPREGGTLWARRLQKGLDSFAFLRRAVDRGSARASVEYSSVKPREGGTLWARRLQKGLDSFAFLRVPSRIAIPDRRSRCADDA